ncbi:hypothetical protein KIN20_004674 [Parelaphostrongylus tenuis]|uniref:Ground-like domain-containing protein n=1 Tax=Parelaphostrongylus tenuis TaxID=148309 RepID=A0AAD5MKA4_PARTN|nr:hypothetical protein KIN20_004674 [Parelaphostrongylus tenuis]
MNNILQNTLLPVRFETSSFPTLTPTEGTTEPYTVVSSDTPRKRSEGPIVSHSVLDSIRNWRKRLYKAFKSSRSKQSVNQIMDHSNPSQMKAMPKSNVVDFNDIIPIVVDKNRQVLLKRKLSDWKTTTEESAQTFGRDPTGKVVRLFGTEASGYHIKPFNDSPLAQTSSDYLPLSPMSTNGQTYRIYNGQKVVYVPASHATQSPPISAPLAVLPPLITFPYPRENLIPEYSSASEPRYTTASPFWQQYRGYPHNFGQNHAGANYVLATRPPSQPIVERSYSTAAPYNIDQYESSEDENTDDQMQTCTGEPTCTNGHLVSQDRCNSLRLRTIIQNNIVRNDAEASKQAVQTAAEEETGQFFNVICGTGFFSYIAHTDEFCLASMFDVNCYLFSPVCGDTSNTMFTKLRKSYRKVYLNRN